MIARSLDELAERIDYGLTASARDVDGPRFLRITDIQNGSVDWRTVPGCNADGDLGDYRLAPGDIVFARTGGTTGKSFLIRDCPVGAVFASYLIRVRPGAQVDPAYLSYFFDSPAYWTHITSSSNGSAQPGVNASRLRALRVPIRPLPDQRRIAAILDEADALRRKRRDSLALLDSLRRSAFDASFGPQSAASWPVVAMGSLVVDSQYGTAEKANEDGHGTAVLRMNNLTTDGRWDLSDLKWVAVPSSDVERYTVRKGDLLFNRTNSPDLVGKTAVWKLDEHFAYAGYLIRFRFDERRVLPDYVSGWLNSAPGKAYLATRAKPSNNMSNFSASMFSEIPMRVPPLALQRRYAEQIDAFDRERATLMRSAAELDGLFASLLHRAFTGTL